MSFDAALKGFYAHLEELYRLRSIGALLGWDQQVNLPENGAASRAEQLECLSRIIHQRKTSPGFCALVDDLHAQSSALTEDDLVNVREIKRQLDIEKKLPEEFVAEKTRICSLSYIAWTKARPAGDFAAVKPHLQKVIELSRREAELIGFREHPYDALLDQFEPHMTLAQVKPLLLSLAERLGGIVPAIAEKTAGEVPVTGGVPEGSQAKLCARLAAGIGYDFKSGRLDKTHHPFESSLGRNDVRITTRYLADDFLSSVFSVLHETGHALYELGLPQERRGTPLGSAVSYGIHESQSRLWENIVGRSRAYSIYLHRMLKRFLPRVHKALSPEAVWLLCNRVRPSLIRVEADEVTYSLHVVIRMLLEEELIAGNLQVDDLPGAWNGLYEKFMGIRPSSDREGVLQDVHWYSGAIGYFPSYALGNLYGALFMGSARKALPDLDRQIEAGEFAPLLKWLRANVHVHGMRYRARELVEKVSGQTLSSGPFVEYLCAKFGV